MTWALLAPFAKWGTLATGAGLAIWWAIRRLKKAGATEAQLDRLQETHRAQARQHRTLEGRRGLDLDDDLRFLPDADPARSPSSLRNKV